MEGHEHQHDEEELIITNFESTVNNRFSLVPIFRASASPSNKNTQATTWDAFPQGCQFSPDDSCVLTASCHKLELFNTPLYYNANAEEGPSPQQQPLPHTQTIAESSTRHGSATDGSSLWNPVLSYETGDVVRSYEWYPTMKSSDPATCCFLGVSRDAPVHLYDAYTTQIRATYCPYNTAMDELVSPMPLCFIQQGQKFVTGGFSSSTSSNNGGDRMLQVFDVHRPGRESYSTLKLGKTKRSKDGQKGMVSALAYSESTGIVAVGTYSPGSLYLYDLRSHDKAPVSSVVMTSGHCLSGHGKRKSSDRGSKKRKRLEFVENGSTTNETDLEQDELPVMSFFATAKQQWYQNKTRSGVTQLEFDQGGLSLFSTSRRSNAIVQWDLRKLSSCSSKSIASSGPGMASYEVDNDTNQRIEFSLSQNWLWTGGCDQCVRVYDLKTGMLVHKFEGMFRDTVNGVSLSSMLQPRRFLLAVSTGTRHFPTIEDWELDNPVDKSRVPGSLEIFSVSETNEGGI